MVKRQLTLIVFTLLAVTSIAQVKISGTVYDEYLEPFYGAKITQENNFASSNTSGEFTIKLLGKLPATITVSAFGYRTEIVEITSADQEINVILKENLLLDQVVISASRVPERIIESPVTVERLGLSEIRRNTSNSFYDGLTNLKGINSNETSYGFKSINTRGFADFSNSRFVQLVDGMDTAAPALNFSAGNLSGVSDLDIQSVEILPGASSALYGANAYNGIMILNTKNPFDFTGISAIFKAGATQQEAGGLNAFHDVSLRMAYRFSDAFAAKVNVSYFDAEEWHATDFRNREVDTNELIEGDINSTVNYDGVNTYGDELFYDLSLNNSLLPPTNQIPVGTLLRRTGYTERELIDTYRSNNLKFSGSLHYRPYKDDRLEIQLTSRMAMGDNTFQGTSRFLQRDYYIGQSKLEVKGRNFYIRGYYTRNDAGNSYDLTRSGVALNEAYSPFRTWVGDFFNTRYGQGFSIQEARAYADRNRLQPGTEAFNTALNTIKTTRITDGGSAIYDRSAYTHVDGNYNFKSLLNDWADVQVGGSYRKYSPDSQGTIFNDRNEPIRVEEYGVYSQIQKKFFDDRLKLTGSVRYDKSQNFNGNFSPRFAVNYALGESKTHILRASYQTGFRNPTIQEQYLFLNTGVKTNVGSTRDNLRRIFYDYGNGFEVSGDDIINNSLLTRSVYDANFGQPYVKSDYSEIQPEVVQTIEAGYRGLIRLNNNNNLDLDINGFVSRHTDFVFAQDVVVPMLGEIYPNGNQALSDAEAVQAQNQGALVLNNVVVLSPNANYSFTQGFVQEFFLTTNANSIVHSYGIGVGLHTKLFKNYDFGLNYNYMDFTFDDEDYGSFEPNFNSPKHTIKAQFGNENLFKNFGFNVSARWQDDFRWVSPFVRGNVDARTVIDAQVNYRIPSFKSKFKIGGTNLFGKEYFVAPGTGQIGQLYYISWTINN